MTHKIKTRQVVINNAVDFYRYCKAEYETAAPEEGKCQHYRVVFQFLRPSDIRRHHDCDLDKAVDGTRSIYSVRNTEQPLKLKVQNTPCLCPPCILEDGRDCLNKLYADQWREVELIPVKGDNKRKHMKRKDPRQFVTVLENVDQNQNNLSDDEILPDIIVENAEQEENTQDEEQEEQDCEDVFIDLTGKDNGNDYNSVIEPQEDDDIIITKDLFQDINHANTYLHPEISSDEYIQDRFYWENILGRLERCSSDAELYATALDISTSLKPMRPRSQVFILRIQLTT